MWVGALIVVRTCHSLCTSSLRCPSPTPPTSPRTVVLFHSIIVLSVSSPCRGRQWTLSFRIFYFDLICFVLFLFVLNAPARTSFCLYHRCTHHIHTLSLVLSYGLPPKHITYVTQFPIPQPSPGSLCRVSVSLCVQRGDTRTPVSLSLVNVRLSDLCYPLFARRRRGIQQYSTIAAGVKHVDEPRSTLHRHRHRHRHNKETVSPSTAGETQTRTIYLKETHHTHTHSHRWAASHAIHHPQ